MPIQAAPTIVIVDDDTDVIAMVSDYLRERGMKVPFFGNRTRTAPVCRG